MVFSTSAQFKRAVTRASFTPVLIARFNVGPRKFFRVADYTNGTSGVDTVTINGKVLTAGTDWAIGTSNEECASNLAAAYMNNATVLPTERNGRIAQIETGREDVVGITAPAPTLTLASSDQTFIAPDIADADTQPLFCTGSEVLYSIFEGIKPLISAAKWTESRVDALSRNVSIGEVELEFTNSAAVRKLIKTYAIYGTRVDLFLGTLEEFHPAGADFATEEGNWARLPSMFVTNVVPDGTRTITFKLTSPLGVMGDQKVSNFSVISKHPATALKDLIDIIDSNAYYFDTTNLDPGLLIWSDRAHWTIGRYGSEATSGKMPITLSQLAFVEPTNAIEIIESLLTILPGTFSQGTDGRLKFEIYDQQAAADRLWDADGAGNFSGYDIDHIRTIDYLGRVTTSVNVNFAQNEDGQYAATYSESSYDSKQVYFQNDPTLDIDTRWLNGVGKLIGGTIGGPSQIGVDATNILDDTTDFELLGAPAQGCSGCRFTKSGSTFTQELTARLHADGGTDRYVYLQFNPPNRIKSVGGVTGIVYPGDPDYGPEIVAIDSITVDAGVPSEATTNVPIQSRFHIATTYSPTDPVLGGFVDGRAGFGTTTPFAWDYSGTTGLVADVTIPVAMAQIRLERFHFGAPVIRVKTHLKDWGLELGDFVSVSDPDVYISLGKDGLNSSTVWEVTGYLPKIFTSDPGIEYELTFVRDDFVPTYFPQFTPTTINPILLLEEGDDVVQADIGGSIIDVWADMDGDGLADDKVRAI